MQQQQHEPEKAWQVTMPLRDKETHALTGLYLVVFVGQFTGEEEPRAFDSDGPLTRLAYEQKYGPLLLSGSSDLPPGPVA